MKELPIIENVERAGAPALDVELWDVRVRVHSESSAVLDEVTTYLAPHFAVRNASAEPADGWTISVVDDPSWKAPELAGAKRVVIHDSRFHPTLGYATRTERSLCLHNETYGNTVTVDFADLQVTIVGSSAKGQLYPGVSYLAGETYNLVRHLLRVQVEDRGAIVVHGSVVAVDDVGVAFVGDKGGGKTTAVLSLLRRRGGGYVANDRFFLWPTGRGFVTCGWPTTCRINPASLVAFEELHGVLPPADRDALLTDPEAWRTARDKVLMLPSDIEGVLMARTQRTSELRALVVLDQSPVASSSIFDCDVADAEAVLRRNIFTPHDHDHPEWLGLARAGIEERSAAADALVSDLLDRIPLIGLRSHPSLDTLLPALDQIYRTAAGEQAPTTAPTASSFSVPDVQLVQTGFGSVAIPTSPTAC